MLSQLSHLLRQSARSYRIMKFNGIFENEELVFESAAS